MNKLHNHEYHIQHRKLIKEFIIDQKDKPCMDCGNNYPWYVMQFDHVRGEKKFNLATAVKRERSIKSLIEEISKCDLVCANCHAERTAKRAFIGLTPYLLHYNRTYDILPFTLGD